MEKVKGKVAIVTGATSGIGKATALLFAQKGIKVVAAGRNEEAGKLLVKEIANCGGESIFLKTEIGNAKSVEALVKAAEDNFGGLDIAFNNAGIEGELGPLTEISEDAWDTIMDINLKGVWLCMKFQIPAMLKRGGGTIVNTSTNITRLGLPGTAIYTASKAAVEALTQVSAVEYGKNGIRVNAINPGAVDTPMLRRIYSPEVLEQIKVNNPQGKLGDVEEIADAVLWLCSPESRHVNGISLIVDGGNFLFIQG